MTASMSSGRSERRWGLAVAVMAALVGLCPFVTHGQSTMEVTTTGEMTTGMFTTSTTTTSQRTTTTTTPVTGDTTLFVDTTDAVLGTTGADSTAAPTPAEETTELAVDETTGQVTPEVITVTVVAATTDEFVTTERGSTFAAAIARRCHQCPLTPPHPRVAHPPRRVGRCRSRRR